MKRIHIVGRKNSGKTTLIADLVAYLTQEGHRVGTIKHTHHHHELDTPGKDSHRHRRAGASVVGILSPGMTALFQPVTDGQNTEDRYSTVSPLFADCDLVLVEGHLQAAATKVEVWRAASSQPPLAAENSSIDCVVTDDQVSLNVPVWPRSDLPALASKLLALP